MAACPAGSAEERLEGLVHHGYGRRRRWLWIVRDDKGMAPRKYHSQNVASQADNDTQRYIYPLVAPPTPERLEQDKKAIDEQFEKAFALVEQLAKDTEVLKAAEQERTQRLDSALAELETTLNDLKSANRRREDEAQRVRDDVQGLKDAIPKALDNQKDLTDSRLKEVNNELRSLKTLIAQRLNPSAGSTAAPTGNGSGSGMTEAARNSTPSEPSSSTTANGNASRQEEGNSKANGDDARRRDYQDYVSGLTRNSPFSSGIPQSKASIPAWQMAMSTNNDAASASGSS
jgi:peroxin-14